METPAKKKGRSMSPDMLAKLAIARVAALKAKERLVLENFPLKVEKMQKKLEDLKMSDPDPVRLKANKKLQETEPLTESVEQIAPQAEAPKVELKVEPLKPVLNESEDDEPEPKKREKKKKKKKGKTVIIQQSSSSESSSSDEDNNVIYIRRKKKDKKSKFERLVIPKVRPPIPQPPPPTPPPAPPPVLAPVPQLFRAPEHRFGRRY